MKRPAPMTAAELLAAYNELANAARPLMSQGPLLPFHRMTGTAEIDQIWARSIDWASFLKILIDTGRQDEQSQLRMPRSQLRVLRKRFAIVTA